MRLRVTSISFVVAVLFLPAVSLGQQAGTSIPGERKSIDWFHVDANYHPNTLLFKLLRFNAPFPGYYEETSLQTNGDAFGARIVPDWAVQGSVGAKLDGALLAQIKQMLTQLRVLYTPVVVDPLPGQMHSIFIFYDGHDFLRLNYNGPHPAQIDAVLAILRKEFTVATQARLDEIAAHQKSMRETYGDWQNRPGITINSGSLMHVCKGDGALVVFTEGQRKTAATGSLVTISLYHALIFYPSAEMNDAAVNSQSIQSNAQE
jgi:hypothetical protein